MTFKLVDLFKNNLMFINYPNWESTYYATARALTITDLLGATYCVAQALVKISH